MPIVSNSIHKDRSILGDISSSEVLVLMLDHRALVSALGVPEYELPVRCHRVEEVVIEFVEAYVVDLEQHVLPIESCLLHFVGLEEDDLLGLDTHTPIVLG